MSIKPVLPTDIYTEPTPSVDTLANLGQAGMAMGTCAADARTFTLTAQRGSTVNGIVSNPFLEKSFRTDSFSITVTVHDDGTWSYEDGSMLIIPGQAAPFLHTDRNTFRKIGEPTPNPTALAAKG